MTRQATLYKQDNRGLLTDPSWINYILVDGGMILRKVHLPFRKSRPYLIRSIRGKESPIAKTHSKHQKTSVFAI
ncbi:MAG: hypothetical protein AAFQ98_19385, partial [Bacteroidota bacterium]